MFKAGQKVITQDRKVLTVRSQCGGVVFFLECGELPRYANTLVKVPA